MATDSKGLQGYYQTCAFRKNGTKTEAARADSVKVTTKNGTVRWNGQSEKPGFVRRKLKTRTKLLCKKCRKSFWPIRHWKTGKLSAFCSDGCARVFANERRWLTVLCAQCGKSFRKDRGQAERASRKGTKLFCSKGCYGRWNHGENHGSWRGGSDPNRGHGWQQLAEKIREKYGRRCQWIGCGETEQANGQKLSVDHIRPWREFTTESEANEESNLIPLCRSHHSAKGKLERRWLRGDYLALQEYRRMINQAADGAAPQADVPGNVRAIRIGRKGKTRDGLGSIGIPARAVTQTAAATGAATLHQAGHQAGDRRERGQHEGHGEAFGS